jgi:hypothetical protein
MNRESEIAEVKKLGSQIGYGNMMHIASDLWKEYLKEKGFPESGAFVPALQADIESRPLETLVRQGAVQPKQTAGKFRKKPVIINAVQWLADQESWEKIMLMGVSDWKPGEMGSGTFLILTLEGYMLAKKEDWIIKGVKGEFYPCKPDIFEQTYEVVK